VKKRKLRSFKANTIESNNFEKVENKLKGEKKEEKKSSAKPTNLHFLNQ
jgi:hypothetical protein